MSRHTAGHPLAREIALAAARARLAAGHDVVIPQFLGRLAFLEQAEQVARQAGASFQSRESSCSTARRMRFAASPNALAREPIPPTRTRGK